jgi:hypothetical protein
LPNEAVESVIQLEPASAAQHAQQKKGNLNQFLESLAVVKSKSENRCMANCN